jgi:3-methylcrotonyl-CoA carboxylase alpha subunit
MHFLKKENPGGMKHLEFRRILVANRGEIALRITQTIRELDKLAIVIHSDDDTELPFVTEADEAYSLGSGDLSQTYLNIKKITTIAKEAQADAIHPGYGFLAENAEFALACAEEGIHFIGPSAEVISLMGNKSMAQEKARELGIPVLEGVSGDLDTLVEKRHQLPYPLLVKPAAGGGGKGMRIVLTADSFEQEAHEASRQAKNYFGSGEIYVERFLEDPRHIEVQLMADSHENRVHLFERECSLQRRYQKIIEEAPSGFISENTRERITSMALDLIKGIGYINAGTVEFLMDQNQEFYFLEMNTRIQVEHPVTEMITGIDLVKEQITIAQGFPLSFKQEEISMRGHSIEARIYAENPDNDFLPSAGRLETFDLPNRNGIRIDSGYRTGNLVESWYDPMLAKVIVKGKNREDARKQLIRALKEVRITGLNTNRDFLVGLLRSDYFKENEIHTRLLDQQIKDLLHRLSLQREAYDLDSLMAAACFIALYNEGECAENTGSPWHQIGHWRILPEIILKLGEKSHRIKYRLQKGNERMWLQFHNSSKQVSLERREGHNFWIRVDRQVIKVWGFTDRSEILMDIDGHFFKFRRMDILDRRYIRLENKQISESPGKIAAPLNGLVVQINVKKGDKVSEGESLLVIESMKMENKILSDHRAVVEQIEVSVGQQVKTNQILLTLASL